MSTRESGCMDSEFRRNPEWLLEQIEKEQRRERRGRLKIFLGYASGVGKSRKMLSEGLRRRERGEDVVVGAIQPKSSPEIDRLLSQYELIPTRNIAGKDVIDVERILRRHPQVVLIDGLAYDNPPGSRHAHRWQEIEELQDEVSSITGKRPKETVPRSFLEQADDIEIIDAPAQAGFSRLRELALLVAAEVVESELRAYLRAHHIDEIWGTQERILVGITPRSDARPILESGRRNADRFHGELFATYVRQTTLSPDDQAALDRNLAIARELGAAVHVLEGHDPVRPLVTFAHEKGITQIFIGHSLRRGWWHRLRGNPVERLIGLAEGLDVRVFPQRPGP